MLKDYKYYLIIYIKKIYIILRLYVFFQNNIFPQDLLKQYLNYRKFIKKGGNKKFKNIIDIGANSGNWTILFKNIYPNSNFFLIEANPVHKFKLSKITENYYMGLLDKSVGYKNFYIYKAFNGTGSSLFKENSNHSYITKKIKTTTLDEVLYKKFSKKNYDLIKLDTQGSELNILKGAKKILKKTKYIITEIQIKNYNLKSPNYKKLNYFLKKNGFKKIQNLYTHIVDNKISQSDVLYKNINIR